MKAYEHLRVDISPRALEVIAETLDGDGYERPGACDDDPEVQQEIRNFINECRARVQHAEAGEPDINEDAAPAGWLD